MPDNKGFPPIGIELVDIRYRNGTVVTGVKPSARRWTLNDSSYPRDYAFDIVAWQVAAP